MNTRLIQSKQQAGYTKLTAVTITARGVKRQFFVGLEHNSDGSAILPNSMLNKLLSEMGVQRGDTYTLG